MPLPESKTPRRPPPPPSLWFWMLAFLLLLGHIPGSLGATVVKSYVPISYPIPWGEEECIYERIAAPSEHLTASVFLLSGEELASAIVFEGPVAPPDLNSKPMGRDLQRYLDRYEKEGVKMFVNGKFGDTMLNVKPFRVAEMVNFEEEEEDYMDDYEMNDDERRAFNARHDREHQHERAGRPDDDPGDDKAEGGDRPPPRGRPGREEEELAYAEIDDDYVKARVRSRDAQKRQRMKWELEREAEMDDDFVKEQLEHPKDKPPLGRKRVEPEMKGELPRRRKIADGEGAPRRRLSEENQETEQPPRRDRRRLGEELLLVAGEPYQHTVLVESPGWYRLCVHGKSSPIVVEMELRKASVFGDVDERTGHVPYMTEVESHSEIHNLYAKEDDEEILAEEGGIEPEDLRVTKEQLRILERVYAEIISQQNEVRRVWNWRTVKNQHLYSHLVLGNLVETIVYMAITGWQVYTIRKWFGGGAVLRR